MVNVRLMSTRVLRELDEDGSFRRAGNRSLADGFRPLACGDRTPFLLTSVSISNLCMSSVPQAILS